jgi:hypothetical protein
MKITVFLLSLIIITAYAGKPISPDNILVNGNFKQWQHISKVPAGWSDDLKEFPANWFPASSQKRKGMKLQKGTTGIFLNGNILSDKYGSCCNAKINVSFRAKGESGKLKVYLLELIHKKSANIDNIALLEDGLTTEEWKDYSFNVSIVPWHAADAIQLYIEGKNVFIDDIRIIKINNDNLQVKSKKDDFLCTFPLASEPPVIDGKFSRKEWAQGLHFKNGFININTKNAISRQNECYICSDSKNIYFCIIAPILKGGFKAKTG